MKDVLVMLLAGGMGSRLGVLASPRAKPAVPFAGSYRIIDFTLSNVMHARLDRVGILTQYRPGSLMRHVGNGMAWDLWGKNAGVSILPPFLGKRDSDWYKGTADAVYQNRFFVERFNPRRLLILSGDHIYHMDYQDLVSYHVGKRADLTIATMTVPWQEASRFGLVEVDALGRVVAFQEKPKEPRSNLASMGIYVFNTEALMPTLLAGQAQGLYDFGNDIIPALHAAGKRIFAYAYNGYWRDVGTVHSYWAANMDALDPTSGLDLAAWRVRTNAEADGVTALPPARLVGGGRVRQALVGRGAVVAGEVTRSILSPGVRIERGAVVRDSILMHGVTVEAGATVDHAVVDKRACIGASAAVGTSRPAPPNLRHPDKFMTGLTIVGKRARVPATTRVGGNCLIFPDCPESAFVDAVVPDGATVGEAG